MQDQNTTGRCVVQLRPGQLDLLQLAENLVPEVLNGAMVRRPGRVRSELPVQLLPGEPQRSTKRKSPVSEPQIEIESQRRSFEGCVATLADSGW